MNLQVIIPAAHDRNMTLHCSRLARENTAKNTDVAVWDNGVGISNRHGTGENVGNYAVFHRAKEEVEASLILVIHNDLYIYEHGYDKRIIEAFAADPMLGLLGFVGSPEIDIMGGRGAWSWSNFQGEAKGASTAEEHGQRDGGFRAAAVVDGCGMAFRREALLDCPEWPDFPPHHWYDRLFSCQMLAAGYRVGYMGIACDHLNGRTANVYHGYKALARRWCEEHDCVRTGNPDQDVYLEAERQFLEHWLDERRFIPLKVGPDHQVYHTHPVGAPRPAA